MRPAATFFTGLALLVLFVLGDSFFTISERKQALVLQFGQAVRTVETPGLFLKIPFIQKVRRYERRVLDVNPRGEQILLADSRRLVVDVFARYRITDPLKFYQSVSGLESIAEERLENFINSTVRSVLGKTELSQILSGERLNLMRQIKTQVNNQASILGVQIVDVRIRRADLPDQANQAIYAEMQSEREREAKEARAKGAETAQGIRSEAEREKAEILSESDRDSQIIRGKADQKAIEIYAKAFGTDVEFYAFYRSLQAYRKGLSGDNTTLILSPKGEFFEFFNPSKNKRK